MNILANNAAQCLHRTGLRVSFDRGGDQESFVVGTTAAAVTFVVRMTDQ